MENEEINFDEFIAASSDDGYQTGSEEAEVTEEATETRNAAPEGESSQRSGEEPENEELKTAAWAKYQENVKAVCDKEEEKFSLDPKKAEILQELVDRYALNK